MYKLVFYNQGKVYELFCRKVESSGLVGFVEASELVFETERSVVVDPSEERLKEEFRDTRSLMLPMQSVVRIERVEKRGTARIRDRATGDKVTPLPVDKR
ncbi:MAG: DUF1820 family protein [Wenzhouxiangellaceae bacterium]|nr:DUF1820 family protein [Wenzhouxiangellaceae bacterium]